MSDFEHLGDRDIFVDQQFVHGEPDLMRVYAKAGGGVGLRVEVDYERLTSIFRQTGRQIDRGGGLADATFLICNSEDPCGLSSGPTPFRL